MRAEEFEEWNRERAMTVRAFEDAVWELEQIRIVIRTGENDVVEDYDYERAAPLNFTIQQLLDRRITTRIGDKEVTVINGGGATAVGQTQLRTVRNTYG